YLDMATSYLIFVGEYEPTYQGRARKVTELAAEDTNEAPFALTDFANQVAIATEYKLRGTTGQSSLRLEEAAGYSEQLWRWEAAQLSGQISHPLVLDQVAAVARKQTSVSRKRGWISLLRRTGWILSAKQWPRWARNWRFATPRYLIYTVAVQLFWMISDSLGNTTAQHLDYAALSALLPTSATDDA